MMQVVAGILVKFVTSEFGKILITVLLRKLLDSKTTGVTKEVTISMFDAIGNSVSNDVPKSALDTLKAKYLPNAN